MSNSAARCVRDAEKFNLIKNQTIVKHLILFTPWQMAGAFCWVIGKNY